MNKFTQAYIEAALWSSTDDTDTPLNKRFSIKDISQECLEQMIKDCEDFQSKYNHLISCDEERAGHDFWLTRNRRGAGFWDGDWPEHGRMLTEASHAYGEVNLYVGDDNKIYC